MNLDLPGFHVIHSDRFIEVRERVERSFERRSVMALLKALKRGESFNAVFVDGLDHFLKGTTTRGVEEAKKVLNGSLGDLIASNSSIVFVVESRIEGLPDEAKIKDKALALFFPRPYDMDTVRPGYLYYPFM